MYKSGILVVKGMFMFLVNVDIILGKMVNEMEMLIEKCM